MWTDDRAVWGETVIQSSICIDCQLVMRERYLTLQINGATLVCIVQIIIVYTSHWQRELPADKVMLWWEIWTGQDDRHN